MAAQKQFSCDLAVRLVLEQFGDAVGKVFRQLTSKGQLSFGEIIRGTAMQPHAVKQALLILMQHNAVVAYLHPGEETPRGPRPSYHVYDVQLDRVLQILRFPRFLLHIKDEAGEVAEHIITQLLLEGRLRMDQVLGSVAARMGRPQDEVADNIRNTFISLVQAHYVERSPPCALPPPTIRPHANSMRTRKARSGSEGHANEQASAMRTLSLEELAFEKQRFKVPADLALEMFAVGGPAAGAAAKAPASGAEDAAGDAADGGGDGGAGGVDGGAGGSGTAGPSAGSKRGAERDENELAFKAPVAKRQRMRAGTARPDTTAAAAAAAGTSGAARGGGGGAAAAGGGAAAGSSGAVLQEPAVVLWRVNNDEFNRRFRHEAMVALVREKYDNDAAAVVTAMLAAGRHFEASVKEDRSVQLSEEEVEATAAKLVEAGVLKPMPHVSIPSVLRTLANDDFEMFTHVGTGPQGSAAFVINSCRIVDLIKMKQVEGVIKATFGVAGLRVFRLLLSRGQLEQKQVADLAMLPPKDTRELLYRMLSQGFVALQDIPKTADRAPSRTFYTWRANLIAVTDSTALHLYRVASRLWIRLRTEMAKEQELLDMLEGAKETGSVTFTLTTAQRQAVTRLKRVTEVMETSLLRLDEMIAVFNDY